MTFPPISFQLRKVPLGGDRPGKLLSLKVAWICIPLMTKDTEHFSFTYKSFVISLLEKNPFCSSAHFLIWLSDVLVFSVFSFLHVGIHPLLYEHRYLFYSPPHPTSLSDSSLPLLILSAHVILLGLLKQLRTISWFHVPWEQPWFQLPGSQAVPDLMARGKGPEVESPSTRGITSFLLHLAQLKMSWTMQVIPAKAWCSGEITLNMPDQVVDCSTSSLNFPRQWFNIQHPPNQRASRAVSVIRTDSVLLFFFSAFHVKEATQGDQITAKIAKSVNDRATKLLYVHLYV